MGTSTAYPTRRSSNRAQFASGADVFDPSGTPQNVVNRSLAVTGIRAQNFDWLTHDTNIALVSGTVRFSYLPLLAGDVVSNLHVWVNVVSATPTTIKAGLYSYSGTTATRLAASANIATAFDGFNFATFPMATPFTVTQSGHYLAAILSIAGTAGSLGAVSGGGLAGKTSGAILMGATEAAQTDLDASATLSASSTSFWVGWS